MEKKDLVMNVEFLNSKGIKGRIVKIDDNTFTILWVDTGQFCDYVYNEGLLKSLVVVDKGDNGKENASKKMDEIEKVNKVIK